MSVLNPGLTILKPGMLAETIEGEKWGSKKYLLKDCSGMNNLRWEDIPYNSPILIVDVDEKHITFLFEQSLYYIVNYYNDEQGNPYWCKPIINE